jgi:hypothetical protein
MYDAVRWRYPKALDETPALGSLLAALIASQAHDPSNTAARLELWFQLAITEINSYGATLLRRHGFSPLWANDLNLFFSESGGHLSLSQMRYMTWAAVRQGASDYLQSSGDPDAARQAMLDDCRRRLHWVERRPVWIDRFLPGPGGRRPILLSVFLEQVCPIGERYWTAPIDASNLSTA